MKVTREEKEMARIMAEHWVVTDAVDEKQWWELVLHGGKLGYVLLFHKGVRNLSLCFGSDAGESPLLFCPLAENRKGASIVTPSVFSAIMKARIVNEKAAKEAKERESMRRHQNWPRDKRYPFPIINELLNNMPREIWEFRIITDNRHDSKGPYLSYIDGKTQDYFTGMQKVKKLRQEHPNSLFELQGFSVGGKFVCTCIE